MDLKRSAEADENGRNVKYHINLRVLRKFKALIEKPNRHKLYRGR